MGKAKAMCTIKGKALRKSICLLIVLTFILSVFPVASVMAIPVEENIELARKVATEGMVLLENHALPLAQGQKVAVFGSGQIDYVKGGGGSSNVNAPYIVNILQGLKAKEAEGKIELYKPLVEAYEEYFDEGNTGEMPLTDELIDGASDFTDTAIVVIRRTSSEGRDRTATKGDFYLTDEEVAMLDKVTEAFDKVIVVLNIGSVIDSSWIANYEDITVLIAWQGGMEGGNAVADVLCGDAIPSGKLVDTWAKSYDDYPSSTTFAESRDYVNYTEDIFVGYRYFETFDPNYEKVNYEFGYGLSYTTFDISDVEVESDEDNIYVTAKVTNTGNYPGKEVVQVYFSAPQGQLGKPSKELAAFKKTKLLQPGESQVLEISFPISDMSSYDDTGKVQKSAYVLEPGDYKIYVGNSIKDAGEHGVRYTYRVDQLVVVEQLTERLKPKKLEKRLLANGEYETLPTEDNTGDVQNIGQKEVTTAEAGPENNGKILLSDVYNDPSLMDAFVAQLTTDQLINLVGGKQAKVPTGTGTMGNLYEYGIPAVQTADGPAGIRLGTPCTAWPVPILMACTWDTDLLEQVGVGIGKELKLNNIDIWLAPGMNIHRDPLCGRNFEYWSEDPLIAGKMSAAIVKGAQSQGVAATLKHFAANNKETNRNSSDSRVSERALREIYLKGFEIAVKEAKPLCIMSSYNFINGVETSESYDLLTEILRNEWGFEGFVMTDWGNNSNHAREIAAGNDIKMSRGNAQHLLAGLEDGTITRADLELSVKRMLNVFMKLPAFEKSLNPVVHNISATDITRIKAVDYVGASDSVGAELCQDEDGGINPTNLNANEWMLYKINVVKPGTYKFYPRVSANAVGASFDIYVDDEPVGSFTQTTATGGWQNWINGEPIKIKLPAGQHDLKLVFTKNGMRLNWFELRIDKPFMIAADELDRTAGIKATAQVITTDDDHEGGEVVLFQLMKGTTPISIVAAGKDITSDETFFGFFNVDDYEDQAYKVKVFLFDTFDSDLTAPISLAVPVELK